MVETQDTGNQVTWFPQRLSAQVRARLLFARESEIDAEREVAVFSDEILEGLVKQRAHFEEQRTAMLRTIIILAFVMFFVSNGQNMVVPYLNIDLASIPGLNALLGFATSFSILMLALTGVNIGAYGGLIDQFSSRRSGNTLVDPDIITASVAPLQLSLKIFRVQFNTFHPVHIVPGGFAAFLYSAAVLSMIMVVMGSALLVCVYTCYFLVVHVPNNYFGIGAKCISFFSLFGAAIISFAANAELKQRVYLVNPSEIEKIEQDERQARKKKRRIQRKRPRSKG